MKYMLMIYVTEDDMNREPAPGVMDQHLAMTEAAIKRRCLHHAVTPSSPPQTLCKCASAMEKSSAQTARSPNQRRSSVASTWSNAQTSTKRAISLRRSLNPPTVGSKFVPSRPSPAGTKPSPVSARSSLRTAV